MLKYGAKALPEGGWNTIPRPWMDGALIAGDAGGFLNSFRLKGIHLAMKTGMLAAETAFDAVRAGDTSGTRLRAYSDRIDASAVRAELYPVRNVHQAFGHGLLPGLGFAGLTVLTGGRWPERLHGTPGHEHMRTLEEDLGQRLATARAGGGPDAVKRQRDQGKLLARERIEKLLDPNTPFLEVGTLAAAGLYDGAAPVSACRGASPHHCSMPRWAALCGSYPPLSRRVW